MDDDADLLITDALCGLGIDAAHANKYARTLCSYGFTTLDLLRTATEKDLEACGITIPNHIKAIRAAAFSSHVRNMDVDMTTTNKHQQQPNSLDRLAHRIKNVDQHRIATFRLEMQRQNIVLGDADWILPLYCDFKNETTQMCTRFNHLKGLGCTLSSCARVHACIFCKSYRHGAFHQREGQFECPEVASIYFDATTELAWQGINVNDLKSRDIDMYIKQRVMQGSKHDGITAEQQQDATNNTSVDDDDDDDIDPFEFLIDTTASQRASMPRLQVTRLANGVIATYGDQMQEWANNLSVKPDDTRRTRVFNGLCFAYPTMFGRDLLFMNKTKTKDTEMEKICLKWRRSLAGALTRVLVPDEDKKARKELKAAQKKAASGAIRNDDDMPDDLKHENPSDTPLNGNVSQALDQVATLNIPLVRQQEEVPPDDTDLIDVEDLLTPISETTMHERMVQHSTMVDDTTVTNLIEYGRLGNMRIVHDNNNEDTWRRIHLNTHEPFCFIAVGVQGAGKSHSLGVVLENCLIPFRSVVKLNHPIATLTLHYDQNPTTPCEAIGLVQANAAFQQRLGVAAAPHLPPSSIVVLVSPSYYAQRKAHYAVLKGITVLPLLFSWKLLTSLQLKLLMRLEDDSPQLYVAQMLDLLRRYQRGSNLPSFETFMAEMTTSCTIPGQGAAFSQRQRLVESIVLESPLNVSFNGVARDVSKIFAPGVLVVADLSDPFISPVEANALFQVVVEKFKAMNLSAGGKLLVVDEAHKFMSGKSKDGLGRSLVNCVRMMRHDGLRVAIGTQSPLSLSPELLELVSIAVVHRFHSKSWFSHLCNCIPLNVSLSELQGLDDGEAMVFVARNAAGGDDEEEPLRKYEGILNVRIRPRFTLDLGESRVNVHKGL